MADMAIMPYYDNMAISHIAIASNMADMGVYGTSYRNLAILVGNETDSSMLSKVIAKIVLSPKIHCLFRKIPI
jgi:hypothetical protein